jgi:protein disulfide-isomerase A1
MGSRLRLLVLALLFTAAASALNGGDYATSESEADGDHVVTLTAADFDEAVKEVRHLLVDFYAPWCPHCKVLAPEFGAAATALKQSGVDVVLAKVDATLNKKLAKREGVTGFPALKWYRKGVVHDYTGGRGRDDIIAWVTRKASAQVRPLGTAADVEAWRGDKTYAVVAHLPNASDAAVLEEAAALMEEVIGVVTDPQLAQSMGITPRAGQPTVAVLRTFDEPVAVLDAAPLTADGVVSFVLAQRRPALLAFGPTTAPLVLQSPYQVLCFGRQEEMQGLQPVLKRAAEALRGEGVLLVTVAADQGNETSQVYHFFGVNASDTTALPTIRGFTNLKGKTSKLMPLDPADTTEGALVAFGRRVLNATAQMYYMSQPLPASNDGPVLVVTGDTFDALVLDPNKDVLLAVTAPWCQHCKALEPVYERLAKRFRRIDSVVVARIDGTANEHAALGTISGYPSILLFPATRNASLAKGAPVLYDGARTVPALTKFLKAHATVPYSLPLKSSSTKERKARGEGSHDYELRRK